MRTAWLRTTEGFISRCLGLHAELDKLPLSWVEMDVTIVTIMSFLTKSDCLSIDDARPSPLASQSRQHVMSAAKLRLSMR